MKEVMTHSNKPTPIWHDPTMVNAMYDPVVVIVDDDITRFSRTQLALRLKSMSRRTTRLLAIVRAMTADRKALRAEVARLKRILHLFKESA